MGPNRLHLVFRREVTLVVLVDEDVEVVKPEIGEYFLQLAFARHGPHKPLPDKFLQSF